MSGERESLVKEQLEKLNARESGLALLRENNRFYRKSLEGIVLPISSLDVLFSLPFTTKDDLVHDQLANPPHGTNLTYPETAYTRIHATSGTTGTRLKVLDTPESWGWFVGCWEKIYRAIGIGAEDRVFVAFGFGPFIGFWAGFEAAQRLGALAIPAGGMSSVQRLDWLLESRATVLLSTPTYALRLAEVARENGLDLATSSVRTTLHAGEPGASIPPTKKRIEAAFGARAWDHAGMTEVGAWGYECPAGEGLHPLETDFVTEVLEPGGEKCVADGSLGELVLTNLGRWATPVIRYRTGDLVRFRSEPSLCTCGSPFLRFPGGVLGRVDDMIQVRGVNVYPGAVEAIVREEPAVVEYQVEVFRVREMWEMRVQIELTTEEVGQVVRSRLARSFESRLGIRTEVVLATPQSLPRFELKARRFQIIS
ncbi:MAG TPA: phenylacetate--CoA ligase family protein [Vicinamibacteria bacterium]|nr:phenylacetate--CoA ligase family protein [Vicinamibacteria bacterium]